MHFRFQTQKRKDQINRKTYRSVYKQVINDHVLCEIRNFILNMLQSRMHILKVKAMCRIGSSYSWDDIDFVINAMQGCDIRYHSKPIVHPGDKRVYGYDIYVEKIEKL